MIAKFLYKGKVGRALRGEVESTTKGHSGTLLEVRITSYESKNDKSKVGHLYLVARRDCVLENK